MNHLLSNLWTRDVAAEGFAALADAVLKGTCLLLVACVAAVLLRRRAAALRHAVWTTTLGLLLALPLLSAALPGWRVLPDWLIVGATDARPEHIDEVTRTLEVSGSLAPTAEAGWDSEAVPPATIELAAGHNVPAPMPPPIVAPSTELLPAEPALAASATTGPESTGATVRHSLLALWLLGVAGWSMRMALSAWSLWRCAQRAMLVSDEVTRTLGASGSLSDEFQQLRRELGAPRRVRLLLGNERAMPMAWGVWRSCVLVPRGIEQWPAAQRRAVLLHELGHIVRRDPFWQVLVQIAQAIYWFHPLVWLAGWRIHVERERACDDLVLGRGVAAPDYARHLLDVVSGGRLRRVGPALGVAMASTGRLEGRVRSILDGRRDRRPLTARVLAASVIACLAVGLPLAMMRGADSGDSRDAEPPADRAAAAETGVPESPEQITEHVRELIYVIRQSRIFCRDEEWTSAIRDLIEIGRPAVPELVAELDRTDRDQTLRALGFTLRGIGDPRAVPALIRNLPKALRPPGSDCGLYICDLELRAFLQSHDRRKKKDDSIAWGRPVNEMLDALILLTGHDVVKDSEGDELRHVTRGGNPVQQAAQLQAYIDRQKLWDAWWSEHWRRFVTEEELKSVDVPPPEDDPVEAAGLAKFGPLFPTGPDVRLGQVREVILDGYNFWDAASHVDFDTGRTFQYLEGAEQVRGGPPGDSSYVVINWPSTMGIDARGREADDLHLWLIDDARWNTIEEEVRRAEPLELGVESNNYLAPRRNREFLWDELGTFLFTTREGGRGIVQSFPRDKLTGTHRLRYRMWVKDAAAEREAPVSPLQGPVGPPLGPIVTVKLQSPGRGREFLLDLATGKTISPPDEVVPASADDKLYIGSHEPLAEWCRVQGVDVATHVSDVLGEGAPGGRNRVVQLVGIGMITRSVLPTAFDEMGTGDVQEIVDRWPESNDYGWMSPLADIPHQPDTFVLRTRSGRIGLLRIWETADDLSSITIQYRFAATPQAGPPAARKPQREQPAAVPRNPMSAEASDGGAAADTGNYVFPLDISGRALDRAGKPIAGAVIFLGSQRADWKRISETTTDEQGRYQFVQVPLPIERATTNSGRDVGAFEVFGFADGYAIAWRPKKWLYPDPKAGDRNVIEDNPDDPPTRYVAGDKIELDLTFDRPVSISGRIVDGRGQPIPDTELDIRYADTEWDRPDYNTIQFRGALSSLNERETVPPEFKRRKADADGRFTYTGLRPDCRYEVWVRPPGFPLKRVWVGTHPGKTQDEEGRPIYGDGMELAFTTPVDVPIQVVYDDTGEPAPNVMVHLGSVDASSSQSSDVGGRVTLRVPPGMGKLQLNPAHGTPYLVTDGELVVPATKPEQALVVRLRRAAEVEVTVVDADTGAGLANVDLWREMEIPQPDDRPTVRSRVLHHFRSWEVETRIAHVNRPRTDGEGRLQALFEPGTHRIGVAMDSYPTGYEVVEAAGQVVDCKAGETVQVTFQMRRR